MAKYFHRVSLVSIFIEYSEILSNDCITFVEHQQAANSKRLAYPWRSPRVSRDDNSIPSGGSSSAMAENCVGGTRLASGSVSKAGDPGAGGGGAAVI